MERRTPAAPGYPAALYQRAVFTQGTIWQIDSIEPCGAELEKALAARIICELETGAEGRLGQGGSTSTLIRCRRISRELLRGQ